MTTKSRILHSTFGRGEIDPLMLARFDVGAYAQGAKRCRNYSLLNQGAVMVRPGTVYGQTLSAKTRIEPFVFSETEEYLLGFYSGGVKIYDTDMTLLDTVGSAPWTDTELFQMTYAQSADTMMICHENFATQVLTRTAADTFALADFAFETSIDGDQTYQPYYKFAGDSVTIDPSGTTGSVTVTASAAYFTSDHVGTIIRYQGIELSVTAYIDNLRVTATVQGTLKTALDPDPYRTSNGSSTVEVTHANHGLTNGVSVTLAGSNETGGISAANLDGARTITVVDDHHYTFSAGASATESIDEGGPNVTSTGHAATVEWDDQVFSDVNGWPSAVCFYDNRLWFGGSTNLPDGIFSSNKQAYYRFEVGDALDDQSIQYILAMNEINHIRHLIAGTHLQILTDGSELYASPNADDLLTPLTFNVKRQTPYGAGHARPIMFDGATLFAQRNGKAIREFMFGDLQDLYSANNVSVLSSHLIKTPIDTAVLYGSTSQPEQYAFVVNNDGTAASFMSIRAEKIAGWTEWHTTGLTDADTIVSMAAVNEELFWVCQRVLAAGTVYTLEKFYTSDTVALDCTVTKTGSATTSWTGFTIYQGKTVHAVSDQLYLGEYAIDGSGNLTLDSEVTEVTVGIKAENELTPLPIENQLSEGVTVGMIKRIPRMTLILDSTYSVQVEDEVLIVRDVTDDLSDDPGAQTGVHEFFLLGYGNVQTPAITQAVPLPCRVLGFMAEIVTK